MKSQRDNMSDPTQNIFNGNTANQQVPAQNSAPVTPDYSTLLSGIVNERGEQKYASVEEALKGLANAQAFIPQLKAQLTEKELEAQRLKETAARVASLEEALQAFTQQPQQTSAQQPQFDPNSIQEIIEKTITQKQMKQQQEQNVAVVRDTLIQAFGDKAEEVFKEKAKELGMSVQEVSALAATSPKAVLTMIGVSQGNQSARVPTAQPSSVNTAAFNNQNVETYVGRNPNGILIGATSQSIQAEMDAAKKMAEELANQGRSVHDLSDPKVYFKLFK